MGGIPKVVYGTGEHHLILSVTFKEAWYKSIIQILKKKNGLATKRLKEMCRDGLFLAAYLSCNLKN